MDAPANSAAIPVMGGAGAASRSPATVATAPPASGTIVTASGPGTVISTTSPTLPVAPPQKRKAKRMELSEDQRLEIKEAFELFDCDKTGLIGFYELKVCLRAFGFSVKKPDIMELRREFDKRQTGQLCYADFAEIFTRYIMDRDPLDEVRKAFRLFDDEGTGKISLKQLRRVARELGENLSDEELQAMIDEFDTDNDGEINEEEFIAIMTQSTLL